MFRSVGGFYKLQQASGTRNFSVELSFNKFTKEDAQIIRGLVFCCPESCFGPKRSFHLDAKSRILLTNLILKLRTNALLL